MERRDAIKALARAGKYNEVLELIDERAHVARQQFDYIRSDGTRTEEWKRWALARASKAAADGLDGELAARAKRVVGTDRLDASSVFGTLGVNGDEASKIISRRDAGDRVADINDPAELKTLLARATRSGDELLARAVAERALEIQDAPTLEAFMADRPAKTESVTRLWDAERATNDTFKVTMRTSQLLPPGFSNFRDVENTADTPEPGAPEPSETQRRHDSYVTPIFTGGPGW